MNAFLLPNHSWVRRSQRIRYHFRINRCALQRRKGVRPMNRVGVILITLAQVLSPRAKANKICKWHMTYSSKCFFAFVLRCHCGFSQTTESETSNLLQQLWMNEETWRNYRAILSIHGLQVTQYGSADCPPSLHDSITHKLSSAEVAAGWKAKYFTWVLVEVVEPYPIPSIYDRKYTYM